MANINNKRVLAEQLKAKLNSPEYVAIPDLITYGDRHGNMLTWIWGGKSHENDNWINGTNINPGKGNKHESEHIVMRNELEKDDWEEIVNLIEKRNKEKGQIYYQKNRNIEAKLNSQSNLYYYWGQPRREHRADVWVEDKGMRGYVTLLGGQGNGLTYYLYIAENHPILDNFPFQTGFYSIETDGLIEKSVGRYNGYGSTGGESNPYNFHKWVEVGDEITITSYEAADKPVEKPIKKDSSRVNKQVVAGGKKDNSNQSIKKITNKEEKKVIEWLTQYFKGNQIKKVKLVNDELILQKINKNELTSQELGINFNASTNPNNSQPNNINYLWLVGGIGVGVVMVGMIWVFYLSRKRKNK